MAFNLLLFTAAQILIAWVIGRQMERWSAAAVAGLVGLSALLVLYGILPAPESALDRALWGQIVVQRLLFSVTVSSPVVAAAFFVGRFQRQGRPRMAMVGFLWGLLAVEGVAAYAVLHQVHELEELWFWLAIAGVTLVCGGITIFALPPDRGSQKA